jgi:hypothetical protein
MVQDGTRDGWTLRGSADDEDVTGSEQAPWWAEEEHYGPYGPYDERGDRAQDEGNADAGSFHGRLLCHEP